MASSSATGSGPAIAQPQTRPMSTAASVARRYFSSGVYWAGTSGVNHRTAGRPMRAWRRMLFMPLPAGSAGRQMAKGRPSASCASSSTMRSSVCTARCARPVDAGVALPVEPLVEFRKK